MEVMPRICETCTYFMMDNTCWLQKCWVPSTYLCKEYEFSDGYGEGYITIEKLD